MLEENKALIIANQELENEHIKVNRTNSRKNLIEIEKYYEIYIDKKKHEIEIIHNLEEELKICIE